MKRQKVVKLSERPDTGLSYMYLGGFVVGHKINQMPVSDLFNGPDSLRFQEGFKFIQPDG